MQVLHGILNKPPVYDSYTVTPCRTTQFYSLDTCENYWLSKLNAQINIQSMILPRVK